MTSLLTTATYSKHSFLSSNNKIPWICNILSNQWYQPTLLPKENPSTHFNFYPLVNFRTYQQVLNSMDVSYKTLTFQVHYVPVHFFTWSCFANPCTQYSVTKEKIFKIKNHAIHKNVNPCKFLLIPSGQNTLFKWNLLGTIHNRQLFFLPFFTFLFKDLQTCTTFYSVNQQMHFTDCRKSNEDKWCDTLLHEYNYKINSYAITSFFSFRYLSLSIHHPDQDQDGYL